MKRVIGIAILVAVFLGMFAVTVHQHGFTAALVAWGIAVFVAALIFVAACLIANDI